MFLVTPFGSYSLVPAENSERFSLPNTPLKIRENYLYGSLKTQAYFLGPKNF
jgi:hypothetical protein